VAKTSRSGSEDILQLPPPKADERVAYGPHPLQFADLRLPKTAGPHPVAIVIHGGFWKNAYDLEHTGHLCAALGGAGVATWSLEYRRVGDAGGGWPGTVEDVARGASHLTMVAPKYPLDLRRVAALGHSAGGQLALWLGAERKVSLRGVISLAGVADLRRAWELDLGSGAAARFLGGSPKDVPDRYRQASPLERIPLGVPQVLIHGYDDDIVPLEISERYCRAAQASGDDVRLRALRSTGHLELIDPRSRQWAGVERSVKEMLSQRG
jgi:acetyl esterase/lipase